MRRFALPAAALLISAAFLTYGGCSGDDSPAGVDGSVSFMRLESVGYGPDTLMIYSGDDTCGGVDEAIEVTVPPLEAIWSALVGGGGSAPECGCDVTGEMLTMSKPVTTHSMDDSLGIFETKFSLPAGAAQPAMHLKALADDGAMIYLNGYYIGTVSLNGGLWEQTIDTDSLFNISEAEEINVLRFELANTGTGEYGEPVARADTADCMYVQFEAGITWTTAPKVTIDIKPGSDDNPVNCNGKGNGVIPVAILTTDDFDVQMVDCATVRFGPEGAYETHGRCHYEDVDYDGDIDLMLHFRVNETGVTCADTMMTMWGMTVDGYEFEAYDHIRTVPR
jgi:hypothetical protein